MSRWPGDAELEQTTFGGMSRGRLMARVRSTGNKTTEQRLVSLLRAEALVGWRRHQDVPGRPDFIWLRAKVAVFVDGCFWHGHDCSRNVTPRTNARAWKDKICRNKARDRLTSNLLRQRGWAVIRVWECQLAKRPAWCVSRIARALQSSRGRVAV